MPKAKITFEYPEGEEHVVEYVEQWLKSIGGLVKDTLKVDVNG